MGKQSFGGAGWSAMPSAFGQNTGSAPQPGIRPGDTNSQPGLDANQTFEALTAMADGTIPVTSDLDQAYKDMDKSDASKSVDASSSSE